MQKLHLLNIKILLKILEKRINELEFERKIKLNEINENLKIEIIAESDYLIKNIIYML